MKRTKNYFRGCLLGGAVGDAFGAPAKMMTYNQIIKTYGEEGIQDFIINQEMDNKKATITDDTQLTLFTAEGLIRSEVRANQKKIPRKNKDTSVLVFRAYLRWLYTQGLATPNWNENSYDGWLVKIKKLYRYREPGITCITALGKGIMGTPKKPINQSRRCGAVIRIAPVGLFEKEDQVFEVAKHISAITHGKSEAYHAGGALATLIYYIIEGNTIEAAVESMLDVLRKEEDTQTCIDAIEKAQLLAKESRPTREHIQQLGDGFMACDALAMAIYCALSYPTDLRKGFTLAVNQDGNSNSVAAIYGNIVGTFIGEEAFPQECLEGIELRKEITQVADDLWTRYEETEVFKAKYPGW